MDETRMRLRRMAAVAKLELELRGDELVAPDGRVVARGGEDAIAFPLPPERLRGLTGIGPAGEGWTAVDAWQPELPAGAGLQRLAVALREAYVRTR